MKLVKPILFLVVLLLYWPQSIIFALDCEPVAKDPRTGNTENEQESAVKPGSDANTAIGKLLDRFRVAAEHADAENYFGCLHPDSIVFGTDEKERFSLPEFKAAFAPYFEQGMGWKREVLERQIYVGPNKQVGWFEEESKREEATMRTTGVVQLTDNGWKIIMYHTSIPIPNELFRDVAKMITKAKGAADEEEDD